MRAQGKPLFQDKLSSVLRMNAEPYAQYICLHFFKLEDDIVPKFDRVNKIFLYHFFHVACCQQCSEYARCLGTKVTCYKIITHDVVISCVARGVVNKMSTRASIRSALCHNFYIVSQSDNMQDNIIWSNVLTYKYVHCIILTLCKLTTPFIFTANQPLKTIAQCS